MEKQIIFMVTNEKTYSRYPVAAAEDTSLETIWDSQKQYFPEETLVTISTPDGKRQTFQK